MRRSYTYHYLRAIILKKRNSITNFIIPAAGGSDLIPPEATLFRRVFILSTIWRLSLSLRIVRSYDKQVLDGSSDCKILKFLSLY